MSYRAVNHRKTPSALHYHHTVLAQSTSNSRADHIAWLMCCKWCIIEKLTTHATEKCRSSTLQMWISLTLVPKVERYVAPQMQIRFWCRFSACLLISVLLDRDRNCNMLMNFVFFTAQIVENKAKLMPTCALWFAGKQRTSLRLHQPGFAALENDCDPFVGGMN